MASKRAGVILLALAAIATLVEAQDITALLKNRLIVEREVGCVLGHNPCDIIGKQIKGLLPEALNNGCRRCTAEQARNARKLITFMKQTRPTDWNQILQLYGRQLPAGGYRGV